VGDLAGFIDLLSKADLDLTPVEVAEALWLARYAIPTAHTVTSERGQRPAAPPPDDLSEGGQPGRESGPSPGIEARLPLYLPTASGAAQAQTAGTGMRVRVPASTALPGSLALLRALRPLKLRAPDVRRRLLDEAATADATARAGTLVPVLRAAQERRYSLTLVIDTGPAMAVWAKLEAELTVLLQRLGAFRDLQRWYLHSDGGAVRGVSRSARAHLAGRALREPAELLDPGDRRVILLLTDGSGSAWYSGAMARALRLWGTGGPVAILQPLPQQLWTRTALGPVRGRLTAMREAAPNAELDFTPSARAAHRQRAPAAAKRGSGADSAEAPLVHVPVLEIGPDWLSGWARFISGTAGATLDCAVTLATAPPGGVPSAPAGVPDGASAEERVRQFTEQASPEALRLATYLAAVPLSLPVIRHVQQALLPDSRPSHLAEVLLGGLVTTHGAPDDPDEPQRWRYEFMPGVRDLLLSGLGRADANRVLTAVSRELTARFGRGADEFAAIATGPGYVPEALAPVPAANRPFAEIAAHVLARITGSFTDTPEANGTAAGEPGAGEPRVTAYPGHAPEPAASLIRRYQRTGRISDVDAAIAALRGLAAQTRQTAGRPAPSRHEITVSLELAAALRLRYLALGGDQGDLDEAVDMLRAAGSVVEPGSATAIRHQLAMALGLRHARTGSPADITEAIEAARAAVGQIAPGTAEFPRYAGTLGELLLRRAQERGDPLELADVAEAIACLRDASQQPAVPDAVRAELLTNLSKALRERAAWGGSGSAHEIRSSKPRADLDDAVRTIQRAIKLTPRDTGSQSDRELAGRHAELGATLLFRALGAITSTARHPSRSGMLARDVMATAPAAAKADLRWAADSYQTAANLAPGETGEIASYLAELGIAMHQLALITGSDRELTEAVRALRESIAQTYPDDPAGPERLARLAAALDTRYRSAGNRGDLVEACQLLTEAAATSLPMGSARAGYLIDLGAVCEESYTATGAGPDLRSATDAYRRAVSALTSAHGSDDVDTLSARFKLARALHAAGRSDEAVATLDALLPAQERVLGRDHPDLLAARVLKEDLRR
jgi:hypothetical protein